MIADMGDYIIKGVNGELYPCKTDIFRKTYELVKPCEINISNEIIKQESNLDGFVERVKENIGNSLRKKSTLVTEMEDMEIGFDFRDCTKRDFKFKLNGSEIEYVKNIKIDIPTK